MPDKTYLPYRSSNDCSALGRNHHQALQHYHFAFCVWREAKVQCLGRNPGSGYVIEPKGPEGTRCRSKHSEACTIVCPPAYEYARKARSQRRKVEDIELEDIEGGSDEVCLFGLLSGFPRQPSPSCSDK